MVLIGARGKEDPVGKIKPPTRDMTVDSWLIQSSCPRGIGKGTKKFSLSHSVPVESENGKNNNFALTTSDDIYKWSAGQASLLSLRSHLHEDSVSWNQAFLNRLKKKPVFRQICLFRKY